MDTRLIRTPALYLVGFMGSGKSTIGAALADELGWGFADLDTDIEAEAGITIAEIFEREGEPAFRQREHAALRERVRTVQHGQPVILALGGGTFAQPNNAELLHDNGVTLWLDISLEDALRRVGHQTHRPLARDPEKFAALYAARRPAYELADYRVPISSDHAKDVVDAILALSIFG